jgi:hypothetical protein
VGATQSLSPIYARLAAQEFAIEILFCHLLAEWPSEKAALLLDQFEAISGRGYLAEPNSASSIEVDAMRQDVADMIRNLVAKVRERLPQVREGIAAAPVHQPD